MRSFATLLHWRQLQLIVHMDLVGDRGLTLRILILSGRSISLRKQRVRNIVAWIHLLRMLQIHDCRLRIFAAQEHLAH
jgi:hypothetical protein